MITVSTAWQHASMAQFRYQAYLKCRLTVVAPGIRENAQASSGQSYKNSDPRKVVDGLGNTPRVFGSLEPNRLRLNGDCNLLPQGGVTDAWWSSRSPDIQVPTMTIAFDGPYDIPGLTVTWDSETSSYPTSVTITGYDVAGAVKYTYEITDIDTVSGIINCPMDHIKSLQIRVNKWSTPNWRCRIDEVMLGMLVSIDSINNGRIVSATSVDGSSPFNNALPKHFLDITLRNIDGYFDPTLQAGPAKYMAARQVMDVQWGFRTDRDTIEWSPVTKYLLNTFEIPQDSKDVTMKLDNRLVLLSNDFKLGTYTGAARSMYDIASYVLNNSNVLKEHDTQVPWIIPERLKQITTTAPIPCEATSVLMQYIALATCTWLTIDTASGFIEFKDAETVPQEICAITQAQEWGDPAIKVADPLRSIAVGVYKYAPKTEISDVGSFKSVLAGATEITVEYNVDYATDVSAVATNATIQAATYYATHAVLTVVPTNAAAEVEITLKGSEVVTTVTYIELFKDPNVINGRDIVVENPLITDVSVANTVATFLQGYYSKRNTYSGPYVGYPQLEAGDRINFASTYGNAIVDVTNNTIKFNGAWQGTMEVI